MSVTNPVNDIKIDAWMAKYYGRSQITNASLAELLLLLPPDEPVMVFMEKLDLYAELSPEMIAVGDKSQKLFVKIPFRNV